ncbi:MAG: PIG-L deacetylase family protein [Christensenella sp.]|nr:PIG-L deacetylase family protein [Christensenella sp.]
MKLHNRNLAYVAVTVTMLSVLCGGGYSYMQQAPNAPESGVAHVVSKQMITLDRAKGISCETTTQTPQPTEAESDASQSTTTVAHAADVPPYTDVRKQCVFSVTNNKSEFFFARDASMESAWKSYPGEQSITIDVPNDIKDITGFYFKWDSPPPTWNLYAYDSGGNQILADSGGEDCGRTEFAEVPASMSEFKEFQFVATNSEIPFVMANISVYEGAVPEFVPRWEPMNGDRVDLLVIAAHPDDESVFLAAPAVTYLDEGKTVVTGYMTWGTAQRRFEAEEACWMLGEKYAPTLRAAHDMMTNSLKSMEQYWPLDKAVGYIVELIRKYKPSVIVTHDVGGEYGHGAHMETSYAAQLAFEQASDPTKFSESAEQYGVWKPGKLYLHMYSEGRITFDLNAPLNKYNGETVLQVATAAFQRHKSQAAKGWTVESTGTYSMAYFGLFASNVGPDSKHDSMFEHIAADTMGGINGGTPDPIPNH